MLFGRHIVELNGTNNALERNYVWGLDLSRTMDGAGGVGGLLWVTLHTASGPASGTHFTCYDGNGNIVALVNAATGDVTARYEYGPFGEPIRVTGPAATLNPFRFSTKRTNPTTDLVLYEYRAYTHILGRWLSRDPIEEAGGRSLYGFVGNDPLNHSDNLGNEVIGKIYHEIFNPVGHWAIEISGRGYGFGPKEIDPKRPWKLLNAIGTTSGYEGTSHPREVMDLKIKKKGKFKDDLGGKCCGATVERIVQCADYFKKTWDGSPYRALTRNCWHYVAAIVRSCCLNAGSYKVEWN